MPNVPALIRRHPRTHERVAEDLRDRILSGDLEPGDRLPTEDQLMLDFGIARGTLRQALRVLESQGLLRVLRGRSGGPIVTHPDLRPIAGAMATALHLRGTTVEDLNTARQLIEPQLVGWIAGHHDDADLRAIEASIDLAEEAAGRDDFGAFAAAAARVHETLIECSGNQTLSVISQLLQEMVQAYYARHPSDQTTMLRAIRSYRRLLSFIERGLVEEAIAHWQAQMAYTLSAKDRRERASTSRLLDLQRH